MKKQFTFRLDRIFITILLVILGFQTGFSQKTNNKKTMISGYVTDDQKKPIEGVVILVDGIDTKITTNKEGFYKIKVKPPVKTIMAYSFKHGGGLEIKYRGYKKVNFEFPPIGETENQIAQDNNTVYSFIKKEELPFKIEDVKINKAEKQYKNIYDMIVGKVPGVFIAGDGRIRIRGISSLIANNEPLYIVDGAPVTTILNISPIQVKSISVLKGAAASAYGMQGANGVILITLK